MRGGGPTLRIAGYFGHANTGDEALLATMLRDLQARRRDLEFIVVSGDPEQTAATYGGGRPRPTTSRRFSTPRRPEHWAIAKR